jgi:hypothetical protein
LFSSCAVLRKHGVQLDVGNQIAVDEDEVTGNQASFIQIAQEVANRVGIGDTDEVERSEGRYCAAGTPTRGSLNVVLDILGVCAAVYEDFLDAI